MVRRLVDTASEEKIVTLALGGGGAKGFVHIGVIEALLEHGFPIGTIVGTSMGAVVGSLFAYLAADRPRTATDQLDALGTVKAIFSAESLADLLDPSWFSLVQRGAVRGEAFEQWLIEQTVDQRSHIDSVRFGDFPFDLHITATNAGTGESLVFNRANAPATPLSRAVRASISIPLVFWDTTVDYGGRQLVCWDGGTTGNCRFDIAQSLHPERLTIASSVTYRGEARHLQASKLNAMLRPFKVINHLSDIALRNVEEQTLELIRRLNPAVANSIIVVRPSFHGAGTLSFRLTAAQREALYTNGRIATTAALRAYGVIT